MEGGEGAKHKEEEKVSTQVLGSLYKKTLEGQC